MQDFHCSLNKIRYCLSVFFFTGGHCFMSSKNCPDFSSCIASKCKCKDGYVGDGMTCKPGKNDSD